MSGWGVAIGLVVAWLLVFAVSLCFVAANGDNDAFREHERYLRALKRRPKC